MTQPHASAINAQIDAFPALPATVSRVMAVTADPESSASDLMHAILPDQTMCATILKVANSAFFGIPRTVATIERAVVVLGHQEIRNIVIGKAIFGSFPRLSKENRETVGLFWDHAFTCGLAAKVIAEEFHYNASEYFIAGLIHDIGKLAMLISYPNEYPILRELSNPSHFQNTGEETQIFGVSHDQAGLRLATRWLLPDQLCAAIGYHHQPEHANKWRHYPIIVQVADILSLIYCCLDIGSGDDVDKIFQDFLPETAAMWEENNLQWKDESIGRWFELLRISREENQGILDILTSS